jgi:hypothetical protein
MFDAPCATDQLIPLILASVASLAHLGNDFGTEHALLSTDGDDVGRAFAVRFATGSNESSAAWGSA